MAQELSKELKVSKLSKLCDIEGFETFYEMIESTLMDGGCPGICVKADCDYTTQIEPDSDDGWCEECGTNTVWSCQRLAGII